MKLLVFTGLLIFLTGCTDNPNPSFDDDGGGISNPANPLNPSNPANPSSPLFWN